MNKLYKILMGIGLLLLFTGVSLAFSNNVSTTSNIERDIFDQNSTVKSSPVLSNTPTSINTTKVGESDMNNGILLSIFSDKIRDLAVFITIMSPVASILFVAYNKRKANKKRRDERGNFVETGIIKINDEFDPVTICTGNYDFKLTKGLPRNKLATLLTKSAYISSWMI